MEASEHPIIIFDGVCSFCSASVNFIIDRDPTGVFRFVPSQTEFGVELMREHGIEGIGADTVVLIKDDRAYFRTAALLEIVPVLTGGWFLFGIFRIVPRAIRDFVYTLFARNRYRFFGRKDACMIPTPEIRSRFLGGTDPVREELN